MTATASASPIAIIAVVLVVGAMLMGQASFSTEMSSTTEAARPSVETERLVSATRGVPSWRIAGRMAVISSVSPL